MKKFFRGKQQPDFLGRSFGRVGAVTLISECYRGYAHLLQRVPFALLSTSFVRLFGAFPDLVPDAPLLPVSWGAELYPEGLRMHQNLFFP